MFDLKASVLLGGVIYPISAAVHFVTTGGAEGARYAVGYLPSEPKPRMVLVRSIEVEAATGDSYIITLGGLCFRIVAPDESLAMLREFHEGFKALRKLGQIDQLDPGGTALQELQARRAYANSILANAELTAASYRRI